MMFTFITAIHADMLSVILINSFVFAVSDRIRMIKPFASIAHGKRFVVFHRNYLRVFYVSHVPRKNKLLLIIYTYLIFIYLLFTYIKNNGTDGTDKNKTYSEAGLRCPTTFQNHGTLMGHSWDTLHKNVENWNKNVN